MTSRSTSAPQTRTGRRRAHLGVTRLEDRTVPSPIGTLDVLTETSILAGWAADPTVTTAAIDVDMYVDGAFQSRTHTDQPRPDVSAYLNSTYQSTAFTGNYGFAIPLPAPVLANPSAHTVVLYALNVNTLGNAPIATRTVPPGYATITGGPDGSGAAIQIQSSGRDGGAISSLVWNGFQFINSHDQGRLLQSDYQATTHNHTLMAGGLYNPTEGGSQDDFAAARPTSTSQLQAISTPQMNQLVTRSNMAFWLYQGEYDDPNNPPAYDNIPATAPNLGSDSFIAKTVTIGYAGNNNIVQYNTTFTIPSAGSQHLDAGDYVQTVQFAILDCFFQADPHQPEALTQAWTYDPVRRTNVSPVSLPGSTPNGATARYPKIVATPDGRYAFAVVTAGNPLTSGADGRGDEVGARYTPLGYNPADPYNPSDPPGTTLSVSMNASDKPGHPIGGDYTFSNYLVVGSLGTVVNSLRTLQTAGQVFTPGVHAGAPAAGVAPGVVWHDPSTSGPSPGRNDFWYFQDRAAGTGSYPYIRDWFQIDATAPGAVAYRGDFNGDGTQDILWVNAATGRKDVWYQKDRNGSSAPYAWLKDWFMLDRTTPAGATPTVGDFNGDGTDDILWHNAATAYNEVWYMKDRAGNTASQAWLKSATTIASAWGKPTAGDYNGDRTDDILWHFTDTSGPNVGRDDVWYMQDAALGSGAYPYIRDWFTLESDANTAPGAVAVAGDFNGDWTDDLLWYNPATGQTDVWCLKDRNWSTANHAWLREWFSVGTNWGVPVAGDYNGDGTDDILWHNAATSRNDLWYLRNDNFAPGVANPYIKDWFQIAGSWANPS